MTGVEGMSAFAGDPQPVEVLHRGAWWAGDLLGWRFDADGRCVARVRCVVDGLRHSAWMDLADLRLPERSRRIAATGIPALPPLPRRTPTAAPRGRHRPDDDETQPHLLLAEASGRRPSPGNLRPRETVHPAPQPVVAGPAAPERLAPV